MPMLPSGRHTGITANRFACLADQYEETGKPEVLGHVHSDNDLKPFIDVLYFHAAPPIKTPKTSPRSQLPGELTPYPSGFTLATIEDEVRSWSEDDREAFHAFLRRSDIVELLKAAFSRALTARVTRKLKTGAELTKDDGMTALIALLMSENGKRIAGDDSD